MKKLEMLDSVLETSLPLIGAVVMVSVLNEVHPEALRITANFMLPMVPKAPEIAALVDSYELMPVERRTGLERKPVYPLGGDASLRKSL